MKMFLKKKDTFLQSSVQLGLSIFCSLVFYLLSTLTFANCEGCLCQGEPCKLCPLPAMENAPLKPNEPELCARIKEKVPPTSAHPGSNEYFPNLDKSIRVCMREGGDVIRNRQRSSEFPARFYCKPPIK